LYSLINITPLLYWHIVNNIILSYFNNCNNQFYHFRKNDKIDFYDNKNNSPLRAVIFIRQLRAVFGAILLIDNVCDRRCTLAILTLRANF